MHNAPMTDVCRIVRSCIRRYLISSAYNYALFCLTRNAAFSSSWLEVTIYAMKTRPDLEFLVRSDFGRRDEPTDKDVAVKGGIIQKKTRRENQITTTNRTANLKMKLHLGTENTTCKRTSDTEEHTTIVISRQQH